MAYCWMLRCEEEEEEEEFLGRREAATGIGDEVSRGEVFGCRDERAEAWELRKREEMEYAIAKTTGKTEKKK